jgi:hypothetical protein
MFFNVFLEQYIDPDFFRFITLNKATNRVLYGKP